MKPLYLVCILMLHTNQCTYTMHNPGQLSTFTERLSNLPKELRDSILDAADLTSIPMHTKTFHLDDEGTPNAGYSRLNAFTLLPTTYLSSRPMENQMVSKDSFMTVIGKNVVLTSYCPDRMHYKDRTSVNVYSRKTIDSHICDINDRCGIIAFSHLKNDDHMLCILRDRRLVRALVNNVGLIAATDGHSLLKKQSGTVTALALHKLARTEIYRCVYASQRGTRLEKWLLEDHTLNEMRFFNIYDSGISLIRSSPSPCIFKELFPLSNTGSAYLGLDTKGDVWTMHMDNAGMVSYSEKRTKEPVSHIAVNNEYTTASGFHPLIILLMGNRLMAADLALKPKTILFHIATLPDAVNVIRLELCNAYYGVVCKKQWTESVKEFFSFDPSWSGQHPHHSQHPYLIGRENIINRYLVSELKKSRNI
jgi:hypothetical protein